MSARKSAGFGRFINLFLLNRILIRYTITPPRTGLKVEALFRASRRVPRHLTIIGRSVLGIITITILRKLLPFGSHLSRSLNEVVFGTQVVAVVSLVNLSNIVQNG